MAQLMPLPLTVSCFSKIQIGFTFLAPAHLGNPGQRAVKRVCVCVLFLTARPQRKQMHWLIREVSRHGAGCGESLSVVAFALLLSGHYVRANVYVFFKKYNRIRNYVSSNAGCSS